jgi:hypothetical protein
VKPLIAASVRGCQVGVDDSQRHRPQNWLRHRLVLQQQGRHTQTGRQWTSPRHDQDALGSGVDLVGHGEELSTTGVEHRRRNAHDRDGPVIRCQSGKAIQTRSCRAFTDDQILLSVPAVECALEFVERRRLVVEDQHRWFSHRRSSSS